jgi:hypothetical protein
LVSATRFVRIADDGVPPTNQTQSGKLPQKTIDNMVSNKKQQANEKAAAAKAAKESEIAGNRNQDTSMLEGGQDETTTSVGSKRKATPQQDNTGHEGTRTSITYMGIDGMEVPSMGGSAERQMGTQLSAPVAEVGSSLAANVAAETDFATAAQVGRSTRGGANPAE